MALARAPLQLAPLILIGGMSRAPAGITTTSLLDAVAAEGALTGAYTVMVGLGLAGSAVGQAAAGEAASQLGPAAVFLLAAVTAAGVCLWTLVRRHTLGAAAGTSRQVDKGG
jgi:hypothetical protein